MAGRRVVARPQRLDPGSRSEPFEVFTRPQRSLPARIAGLTLRLRAEITTVVVALLCWRWLTDRLGVTGAGVTVLLVVAVLAAVGPSRRYLHRRALAVWTRHRLRAVFVERRVMNYSGNLPVQLWARPTPVGERVWLLMRAGIDLGDVERQLDHVASGCFARSARAFAFRSVTAVVVVDVVRRDPLTTGPVVRSAFTNPDRLRLVPASKGA
jgi:hypothetical protein